MKLTQFIDGVDGMILKNYLFCQRYDINVRETELNVINPFINTIRADTDQIFRMEEAIEKPFEEITLTDVLSLGKGSYFKYKAIISNIYFRYFNIKLIEEIFDATTLSKSQIKLKYGGNRKKCEYLATQTYDADEYIKKYTATPEEISIYVGRVGRLPDYILKRSVDFAVLVIDSLLDNDDPYETYKNLCDKYDVKYSHNSNRSIKIFTKNITFYRNYRRYLNNIAKKGAIMYKGEVWQISRIYKTLPFLYYIWLTIKGQIPGRKWDKKLGVVKTDE